MSRTIRRLTLRELLFVLFALGIIIPTASAEYLAVTMDVTERSVKVHDIELAFTGSLLSPGDGTPVTLDIIDGSWRSIARAKVTANLVSVSDTAAGTIGSRPARTRITALVPMSEEARILVVRGPLGEGDVFDLRAASCGSDPLCEDCARRYPAWCETARTTTAPIDTGIVVAVAINVLVICALAVFLIARSRT